MENKIYAAMVQSMKDINAVAKGEKNQKQGWMFRGVDTIYNELHNILANNGIFMLPEVISDETEERTTASGGNLIYRKLRIKYHFVAGDGSEVTATIQGEAMDSGDKASNKAMAIGHKYTLLQVFLIPTEEQKDPDYYSPAISVKKSVPMPKKIEPPINPDDPRTIPVTAIPQKVEKPFNRTEFISSVKDFLPPDGLDQATYSQIMDDFGINDVIDINVRDLAEQVYNLLRIKHKAYIGK